MRRMGISKKGANKTAFMSQGKKRVRLPTEGAHKLRCRGPPPHTPPPEKTPKKEKKSGWWGRESSGQGRGKAAETKSQTDAAFSKREGGALGSRGKETGEF